MSFSIEILKVGVESKGKYRVAVVDHKTGDGKVDSKKIMSFANKDFPSTADVFKTLSQAQQGDQYEIEAKKDTNGFWQWIAAVSVGKASVPASPGGKVVSQTVRSSYETPEERAARQVYIVRQSSIANAVANLSRDGARPSVDEIIDLAKEFEAYVFGVNRVSPEEVE